MRTVITLAILLVLGFAGARGFTSRVSRRLVLAGLFSTGMEFLLLGIAFGPLGLRLINEDVLKDLEPIVYLSLGWIGLLFGIDLSWLQVRRTSVGIFRALLADVIAFLVLFSPVFFFVVRWGWPDLTAFETAVTALVFGIVASISSPTIVAMVSQRLPARGPVASTLGIMTALSPLFPLVAFGLLFMVVHPSFLGLEGVGFGVLWWVFVNVVGLLLGFLMVLFTTERTSDNEMLLIVMGTVLLVGGICYFLELSSLYTALIIGVVVGNFSRKREQIFRELHHIEKTLFFGFLIIAGAMLDFVQPVALVVTAASYVVLRVLIKWWLTGSAMSAWISNLAPVGRRAGLAMTGQGVMALAIAMDCVLASHDFVLKSALTVLALAVMANDMIGYTFALRVMRASGEVSTTPRRGGKGEW